MRVVLRVFLFQQLQYAKHKMVNAEVSWCMTHINDKIDGCGMNQFITVGHAGDAKITIKLLLVGLPLRHFGWISWQLLVLTDCIWCNNNHFRPMGWSLRIVLSQIKPACLYWKFERSVFRQFSFVFRLYFKK